MSPPDLRTVFGDLVLWLHSRERQATERYKDKAQDIYNDLLANHQHFSDLELEKLLRNRDRASADFIEMRRFLFLEASDKGTGHLPVLSMKFDFGKDPPAIVLRLALYIAGDVDESTGKATREAIGYRLETAEGPSGRNDFFHVQPITAWVKNDQRWTFGTVPWMPTSIPAFPLDARDPVSLIVCVLMSIYGSNFLNVLRGVPFANNLKPYLQQMHCGRA